MKRIERSASALPARLSHGLSRAVAGVGFTAVLAAHVGYPVVVRWLASRRSPSWQQGERLVDVPLVTLVVPAHNEASFIQAKLADVLANGYPTEKLEVMVVDDGSDDGTAALVEQFGQDVVLVTQPSRRGKAAALNTAMQHAIGDFVVFSDANGSLAPGSVAAIVAPFADSRVSVVGGGKRPLGAGARGTGESLYWRLEQKLRDAEGILGAAVGVDGGIYAVRRKPFNAIPQGVLSDDYWIPLNQLRAGRRVAHVSEAYAVESIALTQSDEFERKTRVAAGICDVTLRHLDLLDPRRGWVALTFGGHRVLRNIVVPPALPVVLLASLVGGRQSRPLRYFGAAQLVLWAAAAAGAVTDHRLLAAPYQFAFANVSTLRGSIRSLAGRQSPLWVRTRRGSWR